MAKEPAKTPRLQRDVVLAQRVRGMTSGGTVRRYRYLLVGERTPYGSSFYYVKTYVEIWRDGHVADEDFAVSQLPIRDDDQGARRLFDRLTAVGTPVSPTHLVDILRDMALQDPTNRPAAGRWLAGESAAGGNGLSHPTSGATQHGALRRTEEQDAGQKHPPVAGDGAVPVNDSDQIRHWSRPWVLQGVRRLQRPPGPETAS